LYAVEHLRGGVVAVGGGNDPAIVVPGDGGLVLGAGDVFETLSDQFGYLGASEILQGRDIGVDYDAFAVEEDYHVAGVLDHQR
jgi:hypothetical protein